LTLTPASPEPAPSIDRPRSLTTSVADALISMPMTPPVARTPANVPVQSMVIACVIENPPPPKSPASRQLIRPPGLGFARAPPNAWRGAPTVQALASLPPREPQDRSFSACAGKTSSTRHAIPTSDSANHDTILFIVASPMLKETIVRSPSLCGPQLKVRRQ